MQATTHMAAAPAFLSPLTPETETKHGPLPYRTHIPPPQILSVA
jgi:hypothetical protein